MKVTLLCLQPASHTRAFTTMVFWKILRSNVGKVSLLFDIVTVALKIVSVFKQKHLFNFYCKVNKTYIFLYVGVQSTYRQLEPLNIFTKQVHYKNLARFLFTCC